MIKAVHTIIYSHDPEATRASIPPRMEAWRRLGRAPPDNAQCRRVGARQMGTFTGCVPDWQQTRPSGWAALF